MFARVSSSVVGLGSSTASPRPTAAAASGGGLAVVLGEVSEVIASDLSGPIADVDGQADRASPLVRDSAADGLPDPPGRVGGEAVPQVRVEPLDSPDQAGVPLLDQVLEGEAKPL
jgi:hypothetical protein